MNRITAQAVRNGDKIEVTVSGYLPDSCHSAEVVDVYPGGNVIYVADPGTAQILIKEVVETNGALCTMQLLPWSATRIISDKAHQAVAILVDGKEVFRTKILPREKTQYIVIAMTGGIMGGLQHSYSIVPYGTSYLAIYSQVFGPASYEACEDWITHAKSGFVRGEGEIAASV